MRKPHACRSVAVLSAVLCAPLALDAQTTTFTAPSGYSTIVADAAVDATTPKYSFISHSLARKRQAAAVVSSGGTDSLTVTGAGWAVDEFAGANGAHYVLITSGTKEGNLYDIASNTADTLTLKTGSGDFSSGVAGESITIYEHNTLGTVFTADPVAKGVVGAFDAATSDQVLLFDPTSGFKTYFYKTVDDLFDLNDKIGWVEAGDTTVEVSDTVIPPNKGFVYLRRDHTAELSVVVFGDVIDASINVPIIPGFNLINVPTPVNTGVTLDSSGLAPANPTDPIDLNIHLKAGFDAATAETIFVWNGTTYLTYFFKNVDDLFDLNDKLGWVEAGDTSVQAGSTPLEPGSFFISRQTGNPPLDWVFPSVVP